MNRLAATSFICSAVSFGGAAYKFSTTGVTLAPLMLLGIGASFVSLGFIKVFEKKGK